MERRKTPKGGCARNTCSVRHPFLNSPRSFMRIKRVRGPEPGVTALMSGGLSVCKGTASTASGKVRSGVSAGPVVTMSTNTGNCTAKWGGFRSEPDPLGTAGLEAASAVRAEFASDRIAAFLVGGFAPLRTPPLDAGAARSPATSSDADVCADCGRAGEAASCIAGGPCTRTTSQTSPVAASCRRRSSRNAGFFMAASTA